jgi:hypothetical protein
MELLPSHHAIPTPTAYHLASVAFHSPMDTTQGSSVSGDAIVSIMAAKHLIELIGLFLQWRVPHPPHLFLKAHQRTAQS